MCVSFSLPCSQIFRHAPDRVVAHERRHGGGEAQQVLVLHRRLQRRARMRSPQAQGPASVAAEREKAEEICRYQNAEEVRACWNSKWAMRLPSDSGRMSTSSVNASASGEPPAACREQQQEDEARLRGLARGVDVRGAGSLDSGLRACAEHRLGCETDAEAAPAQMGMLKLTATSDSSAAKATASTASRISSTRNIKNRRLRSLCARSMHSARPQPPPAAWSVARMRLVALLSIRLCARGVCAPRSRVLARPTPPSLCCGPVVSIQKPLPLFSPFPPLLKALLTAAPPAPLR